MVRNETIEAATGALYRIGVFNQYVRQQTDFNTAHLAEFVDGSLREEQRQVLAKAVAAQSELLHWEGIGERAWYLDLRRKLDTNIEVLREQRKWWGWARLWHRER